MECDGTNHSNLSNKPDENLAVNSLILDYYKKFGRKRDLEQYFSLSTAQSDIRDLSSLFWRKMKAQNDSSDSGEKKVESGESSTEVCRISIKCSVPPLSSSQDEDTKSKSDSVSPPIISEEVEQNPVRHSDNEYNNSDDNQSQKSIDIALDTSMNKPFSPTSSITSQRKLEWDSLADVGYANESDRKTSGSSLSTLERLALKQQYSNNGSKEMGLPTAHSTPLDQTENKVKAKKGAIKKITTIHKRDIDNVELCMPEASAANPQSINVNLTKHISFNVEKDGGVTVGNVKNDVKVTPEKISVETEVTPQIKSDKEVQTSFIKTKERSNNSGNLPRSLQPSCSQAVPVLINLNSIKRKQRRRKMRTARKKIRNKKKLDSNKENVPVQEKSGEPVSEAESFEYMPGHIYNQNQLERETPKASSGTNAGNKSSLESSGALTTDSSKGSKYSFTKDLEKSIDFLKAALQKRYVDSDHKNKLIKEVVERLLSSKYRDDESATDFLSGLSYGSKKLGLGEGNYTTTSSDNTGEKAEIKRPKKSILRSDKFNSNAIASTSQSVPNLYSVSNEKAVMNIIKPIISSNTESDVSSKAKNSSDSAFLRTSSEELYQKYLEALRREQAYKRHLKEKETFLHQKLVSSENNFRAPMLADVKAQNRLKDLIKDLTRNNYNDGSGDASKLEGGSNSNIDLRSVPMGKQRSHSVFTLSSNSDKSKKNALRNRLQEEIDTTKAGTSKNEQHYCCCPFHSTIKKCAVHDSSVQVNIEPSKKTEKLKISRNVNLCCGESHKNAKIVTDASGDIKYLYLCTEKPVASQKEPDDLLIFKCSRLNSQGMQLEQAPSATSNTVNVQCNNACKEAKLSPLSTSRYREPVNTCCFGIHACNSEKMPELKMTTKSSQTDILHCNASERNVESLKSDIEITKEIPPITKLGIFENIQEPYNTDEYVRECARLIQTEISICPKISDPSISDVNIINDQDCVKLMEETCRLIRKPSTKNSESECLEKQNEGPLCSVSEACGFNAPDIHTIEGVVFERNTGSNTESAQITPDNFTIPIQGTNMTLLVRIDSSAKTPLERRINQKVTQGTTTDNPAFRDTYTSLQKDCSKAVQSPITNIFTEMSNSHSTELPRSGVCSRENNTDQNSAMSFKKSCLVNTCFVGDEITSNTYPKSVKINDKKTLIRSNTDIANLKENIGCFVENRASFVDTDSSNKRDVEIQNNFSKLPENDNNSQKTKGLSDNNSQKTKSCVHNNDFIVPSEGNKYQESKSDSQSEKSKTNFEKSSKTSGSSMNPQNIKNRSRESSPLLKSYGDIASDSSKSGKSKCSENSTQQKDASTNSSVSYENVVGDKSCSEKSKKWEKDKENTSTGKLCDSNEKPRCEKSSKCSGKCNPLSCLGKCAEKKASNSGEQSSCRRSGTDNKSEKSKGSPKKSAIHSSCKSKNKPSGSSSYEKSNGHGSGKPSQPKKNSKIKDEGSNKDEILSVIQDITKRYSKKDLEKGDRKNCFKEIVSVLNYLLDTEESTDQEPPNDSEDCATQGTDSDFDHVKTETHSSETCASQPNKVDKGIQLTPDKSKSNKNCDTQSSDFPISSNLPGTSTDSTTCKVLNKIKKQCEKFHQKRCCKASHCTKNSKCDISSSTSVSCEQCRRVHHCPCRHKCSAYKQRTALEKIKKKFVAYNLIVQTSDSMTEEPCHDKPCQRPLKNIIVKVPSKCKPLANLPFKEVSSKIERSSGSPRYENKTQRSKSWPHEFEVSSTDECPNKDKGLTVRDYLEQNRPDFVDNCSQRQQCLKFISQSRANERATKRQLLSLQLEKRSALDSISVDELRAMAREFGIDARKKTLAPKFISEREMKQHSERIYKSLPEVTRKKEEVRKERIKKTNLLMASIFRKNLQKKTLRGAVNLSNYSAVIKI